MWRRILGLFRKQVIDSDIEREMHLHIDQLADDYLLRLRRADGTAMWVEVTARAEAKAGSDTLRVEAVMRDVTDRKKLQDQSRDLYVQLSQAEKLAALGQTMSGVAHELNNPLATILACAERLAGRRLDPRRLHRACGARGLDGRAPPGAPRGDRVRVRRPAERARRCDWRLAQRQQRGVPHRR